MLENKSMQGKFMTALNEASHALQAPAVVTLLDENRLLAAVLDLQWIFWVNLQMLSTNNVTSVEGNALQFLCRVSFGSEPSIRQNGKKRLGKLIHFLRNLGCFLRLEPVQFQMKQIVLFPDFFGKLLGPFEQFLERILKTLTTTKPKMSHNGGMIDFRQS